MKKLRIISIAICCLFPVLWKEAQGMEHKDGNHHIAGKNRLAYNTILIKTEDGVGTGFYYVKNSNDSPHNYRKIMLNTCGGSLTVNNLYIITNKHVVRKDGKKGKQVLCNQIKGPHSSAKCNKP